jgi:hypothetical protein
MPNATRHQRIQQRIHAHLFGYRSRMRGVAIFAWAGWFRRTIADVGHTQPPLTVTPALEPNITARLGHDGRKKEKGGGEGGKGGGVNKEWRD